MVLCLPATPLGLALQVGASLATGNRASVVLPPALAGALAALPEDLAALVAEAAPDAPADIALHEGGADALRTTALALAARSGPLVALHGTQAALEWLVQERVVSTNTAAAGGNASLMLLTD